MSGPDWSEAPDDAEFWLPKFQSWEATWYKNVEGKWYYHHRSVGWLRDWTIGALVIPMLVKRP